MVLSGGVGKRMGAGMPKQYLPLNGTPMALYSLRLFAGMPEVGEIVVVCDPSYRDLFEGEGAGGKPLKFALPGAERQDSTYNGLEQVSEGMALAAIHDSARPLADAEDVRRCFADALEHGAAVLGVQSKATVKQVDQDSLMVERTLERATLWEVQTPQVVRPELLRRGFEHVRENGLEVTDDVSIIEALGEPVKVTKGSYENLKLTTPEDILIAEKILAGEGADAMAKAKAGAAN